MDRKETCMRYLIVLAFWLSIGAGCNKDVDPDCVEKPITSAGQTCGYVYQPVCGCNSKTYANSCEAENRGITNYRKGKCG